MQSTGTARATHSLTSCTKKSVQAITVFASILLCHRYINEVRTRTYTNWILFQVQSDAVASYLNVIVSAICQKVSRANPTRLQAHISQVLVAPAIADIPSFDNALDITSIYPGQGGASIELVSPPLPRNNGLIDIATEVSALTTLCGALRLRPTS